MRVEFLSTYIVYLVIMTMPMIPLLIAFVPLCRLCYWLQYEFLSSCVAQIVYEETIYARCCECRRKLEKYLQSWFFFCERPEHTQRPTCAREIFRERREVDRHTEIHITEHCKNIYILVLCEISNNKQFSSFRGEHTK